MRGETMQSEAPHQHASLKEKAKEELKEFWLISIYLFIFFGAFTFYRRMVLAEFGVTYLHYGTALLEALIIAKVVLIGRAIGLDKRMHRGPMILAVVTKSFLFALLAILFGVLEHVVDGLIRKQDWAGILQDVLSVGAHELIARLVMLFVSFLPFFAFWEIGSYIGPHKLISMFFSKTRPPLPQE
jgi:hypothetical protein